MSFENGQLVGMVDGLVEKQFDLAALDAQAATAPAPPSFDWDIAGRAFSVVIISACWETHAVGKRQLVRVSFLVLEK